MNHVNKLNEDIAIAKISLLESKTLLEISEKQKKSIEDFVEKSQKAVELFLDVLSKENVNATAIKSFLEKIEEKQREFLGKIQSGGLTPKDEKKAIESIERTNLSFSGFASAMKDIPNIGLTIKDYKKIIQKEMDESKKENRPSKKLVEIFPNDWKKFSTALLASFNSKINSQKPNELGLSWNPDTVASEFINMPIKALSAITGGFKQSSSSIPSLPTPGSGLGPTPPTSTSDKKIKDIFKGANEKSIEKFNQKFKDKFGFELTDKDDLQAIIDSM
jgi:hypothetical protein